MRGLNRLCKLCRYDILRRPFTFSSSVSASVLIRCDFYATPCEQLARNLLGKKLVRRLEGGQRLVGKIVEVEAYLGGDDKGTK